MTTKNTSGKGSTNYTPDSPMPWGAHAGTPIKDVPEDYLRWALDYASMANDSLRNAIREVLWLEPEDLESAGIGLTSGYRGNARVALNHAIKRIRELEEELAQCQQTCQTLTKQLNG